MASPERPQPGAQVEDEGGLPLHGHQHARRVAPDPAVAVARARARAADPEERHLHLPHRTAERGRLRWAAMTVRHRGGQRPGVRLPRGRPRRRAARPVPARLPRLGPHLAPPAAGALGEAGYHAVAPFMRGYAPTALPADGRYQTGALARDANALHEALGGDRRGGPHRPRLGGPRRLRRRRPTRPDRWRRAVTAGRAPAARRWPRRSSPTTSCAELVHLLLPVAAGRDGRAARRPRLHRPPVGRLVPGLRRHLGPRPGEGVHRHPERIWRRPSATTGPSTTPTRHDPALAAEQAAALAAGAAPHPLPARRRTTAASASTPSATPLAHPGARARRW